MGEYGKIKGIEIVENFSFTKHPWFYDGFKITTDNKVFLILIDNEQQCFEDWGYISLTDDFEKYVDKQIADIEITRKANDTNTTLLKEKADIDTEYADTVFVDFVMEDASVLQFAVYNEHNGCYGHNILFISVDVF